MDVTWLHASAKIKSTKFSCLSAKLNPLKFLTIICTQHIYMYMYTHLIMEISNSLQGGNSTTSSPSFSISVLSFFKMAAMFSSGFRRMSVATKFFCGTERVTLRGMVEGGGRCSVRYLWQPVYVCGYIRSTLVNGIICVCVCECVVCGCVCVWVCVCVCVKRVDVWEYAWVWGCDVCVGVCWSLLTCHKPLPIVSLLWPAPLLVTVSFPPTFSPPQLGEPDALQAKKNKNNQWDDTSILSIRGKERWRLNDFIVS